MHHHLLNDHGRMKHNPKSYESFDRKSPTTTTTTTTTTSSSSKKSSLRGSIRRTLSLQTDGPNVNGSQCNCSCPAHFGKEFINKIFNMNINYMFECLFEKSDFDSRLSQMTKKFGN